MRNGTILVADSDAVVASCIAEILTAEGYTVHQYPSDCLTVDVVERVRPDLLIVEQWRAQPQVTPLLDQLCQRDATRSIAVIVDTTDPQTLHDLAAPLERRGCSTLLKPFDIDQLLERVAGALDNRRRRQSTPGSELRYA